MVGVGVMEGVSVMVGVFVAADVDVEVGVAVALGISVGVEVEVAVGGSGVGVAEGLPTAGALHAARTVTPPISSQRWGLRRSTRYLGMATARV